MTSNNVTRLLESSKARYKALILPDHKLSAINTAVFLKVPLENVYKTIVLVVPKGKPVICSIPGTHQVNEKAVAEFLGEKKVHVSTQQEAEKLTGLKTGGISPLALINKGFKIIFDDSILTCDEVHISGGQIGLIIRVNVTDLISIIQPSIVSITKNLL